MAKTSPPPSSSSSSSSFTSQTTSASSTDEYDTATAEPVSLTHTTATTLSAPTAAMTNFFLSTTSSSSSSPATSSTVTTGIVTENGSCPNYGTQKKNEDAATTEAAVAAMTTVSSPPPTPPAEAAITATEPTPTSTEDPHDECVLCCYPFPVVPDYFYKECCGKVICNGCIMDQRRTLIIGTNVKKPIKGSKEEELEFMMTLSNGLVEEENKVIFVCPFCRAKEPTNDKEFLKRLWERIDEYDDPGAMNMLGDCYLKGEDGLSKNLKKAEELHQRAYDLGDPDAAFHLAEMYTKHIPDQARLMKYLEEGARRGSTSCMNRLGICAARLGNQEIAKRQFMTAARSGNDGAMSNLMICYRTPGSVVSKDDLATTLRAHKVANDKRKSEPREYAMRHKAFKKKMIVVS